MENDRKHLIIEQLGSGFRVSRVLLNKSNELHLLDTEEVSDLNKIKKTFLAPHILLALDSKHATTIEKKVNIERSRPKQEITENEMDQLVFKALWIFLNEHRNQASKKMGVADLDIVLSEIEIKEVLLDSESVLSPIGLKGGAITLCLRGTLIPRASLEYIESVKKNGRAVKAVERFTILSSLAPAADFVVYCGDHGTEIISREEETLKYKKKCSWGLEKIITPVSREFSIGESAAVQILDRYFKGRLSRRFDRKVKRKIRPGIEAFTKMIKGITRKRKVKIMVNVPEPILKTALGGYKKAEVFDIVETLESRGFSVIIKENEQEGAFLNRKVSALALAGLDLLSSHYEDLNKMLRRRSKWLVPHSSNEKA